MSDGWDVVACEVDGGGDAAEVSGEDGGKRVGVAGSEGDRDGVGVREEEDGEGVSLENGDGDLFAGRECGRDNQVANGGAVGMLWRG